MTVLRVMPPPTGPKRDQSLEDLLAECGFVSDSGPVLVCEETFCDTLDGRLNARGFRLFHRAGDDRWYLERDGHRIAAQSGRFGRSLGAGRVHAVVGRLQKGHRLLPQLVIRREERRLHTPHSPGAELEVRWQEFTFRDPYGSARAAGPRVLVLDGDLSGTEERETADILLRRLDGMAQPGFDPYCEGLAQLDLPVPGAPTPARDRLRLEDSPHIAAAKVLRRQAVVLAGRRRGAVLDLDIEYVHQIRVATRRCRSTLRLLRSELEPEVSRELMVELAWVGKALGPVRDLDVVLPRLAFDLEQVQAAPPVANRILEAFRRRRRHAQEGAREALQSARFEELVHRLREAPPLPARPAEVHVRRTTLADIGSAQIRRALKRVRRHGNHINAATGDEAIHRMRIRLKKLRYTSGLMKPMLGSGFAKPVGKLSGFQDCLGELNDASVLRGYLQDLGRALGTREGETETLLTLGALIHLQTQRVDTRRKRFLRLWKRFPRQARRMRERLERLEGKA